MNWLRFGSITFGNLTRAFVLRRPQKNQPNWRPPDGALCDILTIFFFARENFYGRSCHRDVWENMILSSLTHIGTQTLRKICYRSYNSLPIDSLVHSSLDFWHVKILENFGHERRAFVWRKKGDVFARSFRVDLKEEFSRTEDGL